MFIESHKGSYTKLIEYALFLRQNSILSFIYVSETNFL